MSNAGENIDTVTPIGEEAERELLMLAAILKRYALRINESAVPGTELYRWQQGYAAGFRAAASGARQRAVRGR